MFTEGNQTIDYVCKETGTLTKFLPIERIPFAQVLRRLELRLFGGRIAEVLHNSYLSNTSY